MKRLNKYKKFIQTYTSFPENIKKIIIKNIDNDFTKVICEICLNVVKGNCKNYKNLKKLKRHKKLIKLLAAKNSSISKKKKFIQQRGGYIIPLLINLISPIISKLI